jgi:hypothetical protein
VPSSVKDPRLTKFLRSYEELRRWRARFCKHP